jgi:hypothetical protein
MLALAERKVETIKIDPKSRYILLVQYSPGTWENDEILREDMQKLYDNVEGWWKSDQAILFLGFDSRYDIKLEKIKTRRRKKDVSI